MAVRLRENDPLLPLRRKEGEIDFGRATGRGGAGGGEGDGRSGVGGTN